MRTLSDVIHVDNHFVQRCSSSFMRMTCKYSLVLLEDKSCKLEPIDFKIE